VAQQFRTRAFPWIALLLLVIIVLEKLAGDPYRLPDGLFALPVGLAIVGLVVAVRAQWRPGIVLSILVIVAIPIWFAALVFLFQFVHIDNNSFSP
jgi:hypothetical protein